MKENEIRPTMGMDCPPMKLPKQENADSRFEEKCSELDDYISKCHTFFMWYGRRGKNRHDEIRSIVFLECLFLNMLNAISCIIKMRGRLLLNECLNQFESRLNELNREMRDGHIFIRTSKMVLKEEQARDGSCIANIRQDVIDGFRKHQEWLVPLTSSNVIRERVRQLANRLQLYYQMRMFGCAGDDFDQHANMVFNALMILATPSMADANEENFGTMFQNSIDTFRKGSSWLTLQAQLEEKLKSDIKSYTSYEEKMSRVKEYWWKPKKEAIERMLGQYGITYINVLSEEYMMQVSRLLYNRLNNIKNDKNDDSPFVPMSNDDLCLYFRLESELQLITSKIESYRQQISIKPPSPPEQEQEKNRRAVPTKKTFMRHEADERKLPSVMRDANRQHLEGQHHAVIDGVSWKDYHVALCLLFYLRASENAFPAILSGLTRAYYNSFDKKEFTMMCTYEQFHKMLNKLSSVEFKKIIACKNTNEFLDEKIGHGTLQKWYKFYHRLLPIFKLHLPERDLAQEKNGFVKLT